MSPPRDWLALRSGKGCKSRYPSRRPNTEKTYARENIMVAPPQPVQQPRKGVNLVQSHGAGDARAERQQQVAAEAADGACLRAQQARVPQPLGHALVNHLQAVHTAVNTRERRSLGIKQGFMATQRRLTGNTSRWHSPHRSSSLLRKGLKCLAPTLGSHRIPFISQRAHGCRSQRGLCREACPNMRSQARTY